ncbi:methyl-accepting chemotaxis protein [Shewanella benthica KT99]|uniref:Methyl-accepting chemotaxis protein n=1 Tax=Shewanella benthica KT99 TaxID=314608 RepID=A9D779_9GAMM|nr:methyl-accepting chemotaxis protein [Shewanella benthica KT99]
MLIRHKLLLSAAVSILSLVAMFGLQRYSSSIQADLSVAAHSVIELENQVLRLRKDEKDFFARLEVGYLEKHKANSSDINAVMHTLRQQFVMYDIPTNALDNFDKSIQHYKQSFETVVQLQQEIGLTPKTGLYGALRLAVHDVEALVKRYDQPNLMVVMLQLRRNEKDFMLRREMSYIEKFDSNINKFQQLLLVSSLDSSAKK